MKYLFYILFHLSSAFIIIEYRISKGSLSGADIFLALCLGPIMGPIVLLIELLIYLDKMKIY